MRCLLVKESAMLQKGTYTIQISYGKKKKEKETIFQVSFDLFKWNVKFLPPYTEW